MATLEAPVLSGLTLLYFLISPWFSTCPQVQPRKSPSPGNLNRAVSVPLHWWEVWEINLGTCQLWDSPQCGERVPQVFRQVDPGCSIPPDLAASVTLVIQLFFDRKDEKLPLRLGWALVTYKLTIWGQF